MKGQKLFQTQSEVIQTLKALLVILVVFSHMLPFNQEPLELSFKSKNIYHFVTELISHHIARLSTCCYFIFSGYFFFIKIDQWNTSYYFNKMKKNIRTLLTPYLIWNLAIIIVVHLKNILFIKVGLGAESSYPEFCHLSLYELFWGTPANYPLWFIRDLMIMNIFSPLFYILFKYTKFVGLILLFILYVLVIEIPSPGFSSIAVFFFGLGAFMGIFKYSMLEICRSYWKIASIVGCIFLTITMSYMGTPTYESWKRIYLVCGAICIFYFISKFYEIKGEKLKNIFTALSSASFFIYLTHEIYVINWLKGAMAKYFFTNSGWLMLLEYFIVPFICVTILLFFFNLFKKIAPELLNVLIGGREDKKIIAQKAYV
ncbi:TPA: acyltransferase [Elizabethkingia anophelis]|nr:acyltransferase [Elizabethkingia anophelis]